MNFYNYLKVTLGTKLFYMPYWQKLILFLGFYFVYSHMFSLDLVYCMLDPDEIINLRETLNHLAQENQMLRSQLQQALLQNQELTTQINNFLTQQQTDIRQHAESIAVFSSEGKALYEEARRLGSELAQAHTDIGSLASSNIDLRIDQSARNEVAFASDRFHSAEKKQLEETIGDLQKQLTHEELPHRPRKKNKT